MAFAHAINDDFGRDLRERRAHLMRLRFELARNGVWVQVRKPRNGRWKLTLRSSTGWPETVMCGGGDGVHDRRFIVDDQDLLLRRAHCSPLWRVALHRRCASAVSPL